MNTNILDEKYNTYILSYNLTIAYFVSNLKLDHQNLIFYYYLAATFVIL